MTRHVLVGSGIAALSAAEAIRETDRAALITIVSREPHPFYSRPGLAYYLTGELPARRLEIRTPAELKELRLERVHGSAVRIDAEAHALLLDGGRRIGYDRLLLATGAASLDPAFDGGSLAGVVRLDGLDDARRIRDRARPGRSAVVVGGGITALELVEAFVARGARTHYLLRGDRYWPRVLDPGEAAVVEARLRAEGVRLHYRTGVVRAVGRRGRVEAVETTTGERIACDVVAVSIGVRPRTSLARASGIDVDRGIITDECLRTSARDVFAAGDAAQVKDPTTGSALLDTLWTSAAAQGRAAGRTMAGVPTAYRREPALNVTRLAGLTTTIIGSVETDARADDDLVSITRGQSERWRSAPGAWTLRGDRGVHRVRVVFRGDRLMGAVVMGDQTLSPLLVRLVRAGGDVGALRSAARADPGALVPLLHAFGRERAPVA